MRDRIERGERVPDTQPFGRFLGTEVTLLQPGSAELQLALKPEFHQERGFAHGGVVSYLADSALTYAGGTVLGPVLTLEMKINYARPAIGHLLIARATVVSSGRNQAVCRCDVFAVSETGEKLCAATQGTILRVPDTSQPA